MTSAETQIPPKSKRTPKDMTKPLQLPKILIQAHELMIRAFAFDQRKQFPEACDYYMQSARLFASLFEKSPQLPFDSLWTEQARLSLARGKELRHLQTHNKSAISSPSAGVSPHILQQQELESIIRRSRLIPSPNLNWGHILGLDRVIKEILDVVVPPLKRPELLQGSLKVPRSVLLFGPPGCGKSLLLKVLASQIDIPVFSVSAATLFSKWQGESQKMIHALYSVAWEGAPSIVFIDEFDGLFSSPVQQQSNVTTSLAIQLQKELQQYMDGLKTPEINQTVTIGATNFPWHIQPSLLRRFDRILYIHPPAPNIILKLLEYLLSGIDHEITRKELYQLSEKFSGYTPDEIKKICETARLRSFTHLRKSRTGFSYLIKSPRALQFEDILASFSVLRPLILKLSSKPGVSTKEFRKWNKMFGIPDIIYPLQAWEYSGSVEQDLMERQYETPRGRN